MKGWRRESTRHALAARGIETSRNPKTVQQTFGESVKKVPINRSIEISRESTPLELVHRFCEICGYVIVTKPRNGRYICALCDKKLIRKKKKMEK